MIPFAAIDLRGGRVVQLVGGDPDQERISLASPARVAHEWIERGFRALHIVDLDAALGFGTNDDAIRDVLSVSGAVLTQVGGGIRTLERAQELIEAGADRVVTGTRAVEDAAWLETVATHLPGRVIVAADVLGNEVAVRGWKDSSGVSADDFLARLDALPLGGVLVTDVRREGRMKGADPGLFRRLTAATRHPLLASGGITSTADLAALRTAGVAGVVLGMALYSGILEMEAITAMCSS